jgi:hypothetical protein
MAIGSFLAPVKACVVQGQRAVAGVALLEPMKASKAALRAYADRHQLDRRACT